MLTGDKIETAKCIAISAGLKSKRQHIFEVKDLTSVQEILNRIDDFANEVDNCMLVIDGTSIAVILNNSFLEERFFEVAKGAPSVCICRCSPT